MILGMTLIVPDCYSVYAQGTALSPVPPASQQTSSPPTAVQQASTTEQKAPPATAPQPAATPTAPKQQTNIEFFPWASAQGGFSENWLTGLAHFGLGLIGALVTVYLFLGEFLPSMGGKVQYEVIRQELEDQKKRQDAEITNRQKLSQALVGRNKFGDGEAAVIRARLRASDSLVRDFDHAIDRFEHQVTKERWRLFLIGFPMYILLGGFFAAAFALNAIQAFVIGFGWTAVADRLGLQKELDVKKQLTKDQISKVEAASIDEIKQLKEANAKLDGQLAVATALAQRATAEIAQSGRANPSPPSTPTPHTPPAGSTPRTP